MRAVATGTAAGLGTVEDSAVQAVALAAGTLHAVARRTEGVVRRDTAEALHAEALHAAVLLVTAAGLQGPVVHHTAR